jgi:hypothetical protein
MAIATESTSILLSPRKGKTPGCSNQLLQNKQEHHSPVLIIASSVAKNNE